MSEQSIIKVNKNSPTTIDFELKVEGTADSKKTSVRLVIEDVVSGCDVIVKAKKGDKDNWSVEIPNLKNFTEGKYDVVLEVVVDGYLFTPSKGQIELVDNPTVKVVSETVQPGELLEAQFVNSGTSHVAGPEEPLDTKPQKPEFPIENRLKKTPGQNNDEAIDYDALNSAKTKEIASHVTGTQGPQLPFNDDNSAREAVKKAIETVLPVTRTKAEGKGKLFDAKTKHRLTRSPKYAAEAVEEEKREEEKQKRSRKVREVLGL